MEAAAEALKDVEELVRRMGVTAMCLGMSQRHVDGHVLRHAEETCVAMHIDMYLGDQFV